MNQEKINDKQQDGERTAPSQSAHFNYPFSAYIAIPNETAHEEILELQNDPTWQVRAAATRALARFGSEAPLSALVKSVMDKQKNVRIAALEAMADLSYYVPVYLVSAALTDPEWTVRAAAVQALGHFGTQIPIAHLLNILEDAEEIFIVRASALSILGITALCAPLSAIIVCLSDREWLVRESAAFSLGALAAHEAIEALSVAAPDDESSYVRRAAVWALGEMKLLPVEAIHTLQVVRDYDEDEQVRKASIDAQATYTRKSSLV